MNEGYISREEHEDFRNTVNTMFEKTHDEDRRQNHRLDLLEGNTRQISALTTSVEKLALSIESMVKEQEQQGRRLEVLEGRDGEMWRKVVGYLITTVMGIVIGYIFTQIGM